MAGHINARVSIAPWLKWYVSGVALVSRLTGLSPDMDKVEHWVRRAIKIEIA